MTPAEHRTAAENYIDRVTDTSRTEPTHPERARAEVHAILAGKDSTAPDYVTADTLLTATGDSLLTLQVAKVHATLAPNAA